MKQLRNETGFTLPELLVAIALSGIVSVAIYMSFSANLRSFSKQEQTVEVQQNVRAAMDIMVRDIRMACYNPSRVAGSFGPVNLDLTPRNGWPSLEIQFDLDASGGLPGVGETVRYQLFDDPTLSPNGTPDLGREMNASGTPDPLAGFIEGLAFAFAIDSTDADDLVDRAAGGNIIWAIDSDADGNLDRAIDTNNDGMIDLADDPNGVALSTVHPNGLAAAPPSMIRAASIWLLARAERQERNMLDNRTYVLANRRITPAGDDRFFQRRLLTETVWMRNCGMGGT